MCVDSEDGTQVLKYVKQVPFNFSIFPAQLFLFESCFIAGMDDRTTLDDSPIKGFKQASEGAGAGNESFETSLVCVSQLIWLKPMVDFVPLQECRLEVFWVYSHKIGRHMAMQSLTSYTLSNIYDPLPISPTNTGD